MSPDQMLKKTKHLSEQLQKSKNMYVAVGLPKEKVGGEIYGDGMSVIKIGAVHEYGADINHPGGTSYVIGESGKARFVSKSYIGEVSGVTKAHKIKIPRRSFLRVPFIKKANDISKAIQKAYQLILDNGYTAEKSLNLVGAQAINISKGAFVSSGYGTWAPNSPKTIEAKGSSKPLIDTGMLRNAITWVVR